jgi:hypothetical protein
MAASVSHFESFAFFCGTGACIAATLSIEVAPESFLLSGNACLFDPVPDTSPVSEAFGGKNDGGIALQSAPSGRVAGVLGCFGLGRGRL